MGHKSMSSITAEYGGAGSLDSERATLYAVQTKLFPTGLSAFLPAELSLELDTACN
jgi:hypothetical protein